MDKQAKNTAFEEESEQEMTHEMGSRKSQSKSKGSERDEYPEKQMVRAEASRELAVLN